MWSLCIPGRLDDFSAARQDVFMQRRDGGHLRVHRCDIPEHVHAFTQLPIAVNRDNNLAFTDLGAAGHAQPSEGESFELTRSGFRIRTS